MVAVAASVHREVVCGASVNGKRRSAEMGEALSGSLEDLFGAAVDLFSTGEEHQDIARWLL